MARVNSLHLCSSPPQRSYSGENTASAIARSCASLALSLLVPVLGQWHQDSPKQVLSALRAGLPGSPTADDSQAIRFHSGVALGMVLSGVHRRHLGCERARFCEPLPPFG